MNFILEYVVFLAKTITIVVAILLIIFFIVMQRKRPSQQGSLSVKDLTTSYKNMKKEMQLNLLNESEVKQFYKDQKKEEKKKLKEQKQKSKQKNKQEDETKKEKHNCYVLSFNGSVDATEVENLRQEISAVLAVIKPQDKVLLKLESPGGVVHGYGLAASQLLRFKAHNIDLTVVVDKVAASGGYMMASTANKIIAAPFAIVGSIGVVAQIPNFHRFLKKNDIDIELQTAGQYKRTLTMLGENTDEGRQKFKEELEETHQLFKEFVSENRPTLDIDKVATGEHWYALQAKDLGLVDEIGTSDDVILSHIEEYKVIAVDYVRRKKLTEKLSQNVIQGVEKLFFRNSRTL